jgi:hypothetical protein
MALLGILIHIGEFDCPIFPLYFIPAVKNMLSGPLSMAMLK